MLLHQIHELAPNFPQLLKFTWLLHILGLLSEPKLFAFLKVVDEILDFEQIRDHTIILAMILHEKR